MNSREIDIQPRFFNGEYYLALIYALLQISRQLLQGRGGLQLAPVQHDLSRAAEVDGICKNAHGSCGAWNPMEFSEMMKSIMNCPLRW